MHLSTIPKTIPSSRTKQALLLEQDIPHIYLGQGLIFVPPMSSREWYEAYLKTQWVDPSEYPLATIQRKWAPGEIYNSPTLDTLRQQIQQEQYIDGYRRPESFGKFVQPISNQTVADLYQLDPQHITTIQTDNLMQALRSALKIIAKVKNKKVTHIILPDAYVYSGHTDFVSSFVDIGLDLQIRHIPAVTIDGQQDMDQLEQLCTHIKNTDGLALLIDQEHNTNASGYDRDGSQNAQMSGVLQAYSEHIVYMGDNAYKGLKERLHEPYPLMQQLVADEILAFHYTSFSKIGNYRGTPSYANILAATPWSDISYDDLQSSFQQIQRSEGIGATADWALLMSQLIHDPEFVREVEVIRHYIWYTRDALRDGLAGTALENLFGQQTHGIFRCLPDPYIAHLNSGDTQVITVWSRINIRPLGDPEMRELFLEKVRD